MVGVIANLALYFAAHTLFDESRTVSRGPLHLVLPELASVDWAAVLVAVVAWLLLFRFGWGVLRTLGLCAAIGLVLGLAF